jgi:hypothetical protein
MSFTVELLRVRRMCAPGKPAFFDDDLSPAPLCHSMDTEQSRWLFVPPALPLSNAYCASFFSGLLVQHNEQGDGPLQKARRFIA